MNRILVAVSAVTLGVMMTSCLNDEPTEYEKQVTRDDKALEVYISEKGIEAEKTISGYYYTRDVDVEDGVKIKDEDIVGIYYEMETLEGAFIGEHTMEDGDPVLFRYDVGAQTLAPIAMNLSVGLAEVGETLTLYVPSYVGFSDYGYGTLIPPYSHLKIKVTFAKIYSKDEVAAMEDNMIQEYLIENDLEGFTKMEKDVYVKVIDQGDTDTEKSKNGNTVSFTYGMYELGATDPFAKSSASVPTTLGVKDNLGFVDVGLNNLHNKAKIQVISPSSAAYTNLARVLPQSIRNDYFQKGYLNVQLNPFQPIFFDAEITGIK
ncbi:hypothetical protein GCM10007049_15230 [Echinicola pacifica]|uniref:peptidylprolyl isomerase n=1 Tax=Echinicola pacifica TaxID=346377 RepID=A0A918PV79_9BACT|nr:hypothetical protein [Echinicola pacifica]GGZ23284.1 hypothetical protein GCM10007049_15230 [Echinicola pacifica]